MPNYRQLIKKLGFYKSIIFLMFCASLAVANVEMDRMLLLASQRYGDSGAAAVIAWRGLLTHAASEPEVAKLRQVNEFFNGRIRFGEDSTIWGMPDYWATPLETLGRGEGDCEDYAIAKYVTLTLLGVPSQKLRLTYVKARIGGPKSSIVQAHMVLSYYPAPEDEPLVLDSLISDIRPASRRPDLAMIFGFNAEGLWVGGTTPRVGSSSQRLSKWQSLLARMREEGIE